MALEEPNLAHSLVDRIDDGRVKTRSTWTRRHLWRWSAGLWGLARRGATVAKRVVQAALLKSGRAAAAIPVPGPVRSAVLAVWSWLVSTHVAWTSWVAKTRLFRALTNTIWKRILVSNLIGLGVVMVGLVIVSFDSRWVINTRSDALRVQGQIIAAAIAGDLKVSSRRNIIDPDRPAIDAIARIPFRDDGFASLELSIRPERVAPILRRLIEPTDTRARVIAADYSVIVDSAKVISFEGGDGADGDEAEKPSQRPRWKDFWTRTLHLLIGKEVQVYRARDFQLGNQYPEVVKAMNGDPTKLLFLNQEGEQIVNVAVPIKRGDTILGVLLMSTLPGEVDQILADASQGFWKLVLVAFLASVASAIVLARTVADPIRNLSAAAERVSKDINARRELPHNAGGSEEIRQMSEALHTMVGSLYRRIASSEKFAADVAHELKNPLTAASSTAQCLRIVKKDEDRDELVEQIEAELRRLNRLITDVASASRLDAELARQTSDPVSLQDVLCDVTDIFRDKIPLTECEIEVDVARDNDPFAYIVSGNAGRIGQVLTNIMENAVSFTPSGGVVRVTMRRRDRWIDICIDDEGPGIEEDKLETIFARFYTFRPTEFSSRGDNSGLGLSISQEIVAAHGGRIWAENRTGPDGPDGPPAGARFVIRLPGAGHGGYVG